MRLVFSFVLLTLPLFTACGDDTASSTCPTGPTAPLDEACSNEGLVCAYGYDPPECGGITVVCEDGVWTEREHTDPEASCADAGTTDAGTGSRRDAATDAGTIACGEMTCGPDQYCFVMCTCCGIDGGTPSSTYECRPIPTGCSADDICACTELTRTGSACDSATRILQRPCA